MSRALLMSLVLFQFSALETKLKPKTEAEFQAYVRQVEAKLESRWSGRISFLRLDENAAARVNVIAGTPLIEPGVEPNPRSISDGLIHDWYGAIFIPRASVAAVVAALRDFNRHSSLYPKVVKSRLIKRSGNDVTGYWRVQQPGQVLPAVFDVVQTVHFEQLSPERWAVKSHADDVRAVYNAGEKDERILPPGEGIGLMWRLYSYWSLEQISGGVLAECRTVSLSRATPLAVAWAVRPFVNSVPRDSMASTLESTRKAVLDSIETPAKN